MSNRVTYIRTDKFWVFKEEYVYDCVERRCIGIAVTVLIYAERKYLVNRHDWQWIRINLSEG